MASGDGSKSATNARLEAALDLARRRMPPVAAPEVLDGLLTLLSKGEAALAEELVERVEQPLEESPDERAVRPCVLSAVGSLRFRPNRIDHSNMRISIKPNRTHCLQGRPFLLTLYNRDGDSHRSPWSNQYVPPLDEQEGEEEEPPYYPSDALRALELEANELWEVYRELYYGGEAVGSVCLWDLESGVGGNTGLAGCFAVKKRESMNVVVGEWGAMGKVQADC